jgi:signal transduction histidine kinase
MTERVPDEPRSWRRELVDSMVDAALLLSRDGQVLAINAAARELLALPAGSDEPQGLTADAVLSDPELLRAVAEVRRTGAPVTVETDRAEHYLRASASLVSDETLLLISDRTQEKRVEELRRDFVVNASHELKTPVTSIQTLAEALTVVVHEQPERVPALVARLSDEAERLAALVHDLLDLRRLEERGPLEREPVDLAELARQVVGSQIGRAEAAGVEVWVDAPDHVHVAGVAGDLEVIVKNLVVNAIKYNRPGGTARIAVRALGAEVELAVQDTGIGIPHPDLPRIFERFYRVDTARSRETGGTGLGLSIVRHAVEHHGGSIQVESQLAEGSTFTVHLPAGRPTNDPA